MRRAAVLIAVLCGALAIPASAAAFDAPDPGGDETALVPLPPPGKYLGLNDDMVGILGWITPTDHLELARAAGGNAVRTSLDWRHAEPVEGSWNGSSWLAWKAFYDGALNRGMTPIFTVGFAPAWAREPEYRDCLRFGSCEFPPARSFNSAWSRYVREVARRFPKSIIEVWNEPNLRHYWASGADPQRFAELQALAYDAVKSVSPRTLVVAGGLSNAQATAGGHIALPEFLARAYAAQPSIRGKMDAIGLHPYPWNLSFGAGTLFAKSFADVRSVRAAYSDDATPLFITEVGIPTIANLLTEAQQPDALMRLYRRTITMHDVLGVVFHRAIEPNHPSAPAIEDGYAWTLLGKNPPAPRPVYCRFVSVAKRSYPGCPGAMPLTVQINWAPPTTRSAPSARLGPENPGTIAGRRATFKFESPNYGATYGCSLDGAAFAPCWSPKEYALESGIHTFRVRAKDSAGRLSAVDEYRFKVR